jgi:transposase, IS5 family
MKQQTLAMAADQGFERHRKPTRRDAFLETMNRVVPWDALCAVIETHYPKNGNGRPPIGLERMLRIHFLQHWFNCSGLICPDTSIGGQSTIRGDLYDKATPQFRSWL